ncbi:hypothetical protein EDB83DRAFT_2315697 [Lactarius deliciosus]|nr:hypothetical protein EDB83DRAFT_2315697 [Lactarius deliciosus]
MPRSIASPAAATAPHRANPRAALTTYTVVQTSYRHRLKRFASPANTSAARATSHHRESTAQPSPRSARKPARNLSSLSNWPRAPASTCVRVNLLQQLSHHPPSSSRLPERPRLRKTASILLRKAFLAWPASYLCQHSRRHQRFRHRSDSPALRHLVSDFQWGGESGPSSGTIFALDDVGVTVSCSLTRPLYPGSGPLEYIQTASFSRLANPVDAFPVHRRHAAPSSMTVPDTTVNEPRSCRLPHCGGGIAKTFQAKDNVRKFRGDIHSIGDRLTSSYGQHTYYQLPPAITHIPAVIASVYKFHDDTRDDSAPQSRRLVIKAIRAQNGVRPQHSHTDAPARQRQEREVVAPRLRGRSQQAKRSAIAYGARGEIYRTCGEDKSATQQNTSSTSVSVTVPQSRDLRGLGKATRTTPCTSCVNYSTRNGLHNGSTSVQDSGTCTGTAKATQLVGAATQEGHEYASHGNGASVASTSSLATAFGTLSDVYRTRGDMRDTSGSAATSVAACNKADRKSDSSDCGSGTIPVEDSSVFKSRKYVHSESDVTLPGEHSRLSQQVALHRIPAVAPESGSLRQLSKTRRLPLRSSKPFCDSCNIVQEGPDSTQNVNDLRTGTLQVRKMYQFRLHDLLWILRGSRAEHSRSIRGRSPDA